MMPAAALTTPHRCSIKSTHPHPTTPLIDSPQAADRYNINRSWEHIQNKHVGTGHPDFTKQ